VRVVFPVAGSTRITLPSFTFATHTAPAAAVTPHGADPVGKRPVTRFVAGSTRTSRLVP